MRPVFLILCAMFTMAGAAGQESPNRNAATWYQRAIEQYEKLPKAQREMLQDYDPSRGAPSPEVRAALMQTQAMLQNIQRGSSQEFSDFNLDFNQGIGLMLPHLGQLRGIAKIARTDAMVRLHDGDTSGAADRIASLYRMGGHNGDDRTLISGLVGQAVFNTADQAAQFGLDSAKFNSADSAKLFSAVKDLGTNDPFNYLEGIAGEQEFVVDWIANTFTGEDAAAEFATKMTEFGGNSEVWMQIAALDEEQFAEALDQHDALLNRVIEVFTMPDAEAAKAEIAKIDEAFQNKEMGLISHALSPAFGKILERKLEAEKQLAERIALYGKLATDEAKPQEAANAAIWYLRGIELLEKLEPAKLELIRKAAREPAQQSSAELTAALAEAQPAFDQFREASQIKRCDFSFARRLPDTSRIVPSYVPGMHDGMLALHADALQLLARGNREAAVDRVAIAFRAGAHLGSDPFLMSALAAHRQFNASLELTASAITTQTITPDDQAIILDAVGRISRKDPFGYIGAVTAARQSIGELLGGLYTRDQADIDRQAKAREFAQALSADQALYALAVYELLSQAVAEPGTAHASLRGSSQRMSDILVIDAIESVGMQIADIGPALAGHDWTVLADHPAPALTAGGTVSDHIRRARGDVRRAMLLLKPFDAEPSSQPDDSGESDSPR